MAVNMFLKLQDLDGESIQKGMEKAIEIQGWDWEVEAESSWTKGGGASVGKPNPGKLSFQHYFDATSTGILKDICTGKAIPKAWIYAQKTTGKGSPETYFTMSMEGCFITSIATAGSAEGSITQKISMVFKSVVLEYKQQDNKTGALKGATKMSWDIPAGSAS